MLHLEFWSAFWNQWAELAAKGESAPPSPTPSAEITKQHISPHEKYDYLTEYGTQILCLLSAEKGCTYLSRNFESITKNNCESRLGEKFFGMVHHDYRDRLKELLTQPNTKDEPRPFRCRLLHADKKSYWYLFLIYPKQHSSGEHICVLENINDTMLAQNTLQKARLEAELALRARSEFLANMSHDLRTPLNAVIGFAQIIGSEMFGKIDNPQYLEYAKHIQESGHDLLSKIEDLLEIANIDAGRVALEREEVMASDIIRHVIDAQKHHALAANVKLSGAPQTSDMLLHVDRLKLQHILGHLVNNAIKACTKGDRITLRVEKLEKGQLYICVEDTGDGMSEEKMATLTAALGEDNCWSAGGNNNNIGLGLALTKEFVALHGGKVVITSHENAGTNIEMTLPKNCIRATSASQPDYLKQAVL